MRPHALTRRALILDAGRAAIGILVLGAAAACAGDDEAGVDAGSPEGAGPSPDGPSDGPASGAPASGVDASSATPSDGSAAGTTAGGLAWERVDLGFVSAYVLVRDDEAAVVDTGVDGSAAAIEEALRGVGLGWDAVGHVVLTHRHPDHVGSAEAVLQAASEATAYAGAGELAEVDLPRPPVEVSDGDDVFGLRIVATPGHTAGHVAVHDPGTRLLVAGDALNGQDGGVAGPNPQFSSDMDAARESVRILARLDVDTVVFGHGDPVVGGAGEQIAALAATL